MQQKQEERKFRKQLKGLRKGNSLKNFSRLIMNYLVVKKIREYCITLSCKQLKLTISWFLSIDNFSEIVVQFLDRTYETRIQEILASAYFISRPLQAMLLVNMLK
jgi:hypothetical protein